MYLGKCAVWYILHHERCARFDRGCKPISERIAHALSATRGISIFNLTLQVTETELKRTHRIVGREKHVLRLSHLTSPSHLPRV
jgi:hypothetical protein